MSAAFRIVAERRALVGGRSPRRAPPRVGAVARPSFGAANALDPQAGPERSRSSHPAEIHPPGGCAGRECLGCRAGCGRAPERAMAQISRLESEDRFQEARDLRANLLKKLPFSQTSILWKSEGEDLLYRQKSYQNASAAYQKAMSALDQNETYIGVIEPVRFYVGASIAFIMNKEEATALICRGKLADYIEGLRSVDEFEEYLAGFEEQIRWIDERLQQQEIAEQTH